MTSGKHKKHADIARPSYGLFGRNEWAIAGAPCDTIKELADAVMRALSPAYQLAYADATHHSETGNATTDRLCAGAMTTYTDKGGYHQVNDCSAFTPFRFRQLFSQADMVLINGNHFEAGAQVLILDAAKKESLQKRLDKMTNTQLLLLGKGVEAVFDFIKEGLPGWQALPVYRLEETDKI